MQQNITYIPYEKLTNIERIDETSDVAKKALNLDKGEYIVYKEFDNKFDEFKHELNIITSFITSLKRNKNIIKFIGVSEDKENSIYYIIMEYAEEGNLRHYLKNKPDFEKQLQLAHNITSGLVYLHSDLIQHDKNIVISHGRAKIIDFGNSIHSENQKNNKHIGCLPFMAPELLKDPNNIEYTKKEKNIASTHNEYLTLYRNCWEDSPNKRPNIEDVE
ncbi:11078_t:CDS:2, partial [Scutellospora calospora]